MTPYPSRPICQLQRTFALALALGTRNEDLNDHDELRRDPAPQAIAGRMTSRPRDCAPLVGKSTLNRLELAAAGLARAGEGASGVCRAQQQEILSMVIVTSS